MYIINSLLEGLRILGFDKETIRQVSKEKNLEEIFLSTLFLNYLIVLVVYLIGILLGGYSISNRELNMTVFFGLLMIYPFTYNLLVYIVYGFFGLTAEMLNTKLKIKPLLSVGFHTGIVYSIVFFVIALLSTIDVTYGLFLVGLFSIYFIYTMFLSINTIYEFSFGQSLITLIIPLLIFGIIMMLGLVFMPQIFETIFNKLFL